MVDVTEIREALTIEAKFRGPETALPLSWRTILEAARSYADLLESGPDYLAAAKAWAKREGDKWEDHPPVARAALLEVATLIVDAALAAVVPVEGGE